MMVKEYLKQPHEAERKIIQCMEREGEVRAAASNAAISYTGVRVQSSRQQSRIETGVIKIMELEEKKLDLLIDYIRLVREVQELINQVPNVDHKMILELRYLNFKTWDEIGKIMSNTSRWTQILHERALASAQAFLKAKAG